MLAIVDFPQPEFPTIPNVSPARIVKDTSFTAFTRVFLMIPPVNVLQI